MGVVTLLLGGVWGSWPAGADAPREAAPAENPVAAARWFSLRGAGSCAAAACHGNTGPQGRKGCEYTSWMEHDPHAKAYTVLLTERSRHMLQLYDPAARHGPQHDTRCLFCHSTDAVLAQRGHPLATQDGVSCERCHGAAQGWLADHHTTVWDRWSAQQKAERGFQDTKDLVNRVRLCAECHIGTGEYQVDHDLIAAGHPRLHFEYGAYLATLKPHWDARAEKTRHPDLEARVWLIGQVVSAELALRLLAERADMAPPADQPPTQQPWPEFAEYNCFACHHDLQPDGWRRQQALPGKLPGTLPWSNWYYAMVPEALATLPEKQQKVTKALTGLRNEMEQPYPTPTRVAAQARTSAELLRQCLPRLAEAPAWEVAFLRRRFEDIQQAQHLDVNWDAATQRYLALAALYHARTDRDRAQRDPKIRAELQALAKKLSFPPGWDSPRDFVPPGERQP
ncbi:MAG: multiheme c-type cytochrome [Gemmataceae bacterium]